VLEDGMRAHVEDELESEPQVDSRAIAVSARGGEVTLRGTVGSFREKREAANAAGRVAGVREVDNRLQVRLLDDDRREDADLRGAVLQALMLDKAIPRTIDVKVKDGVVTLSGATPYHFVRAESEFVAGNVAGVLHVDNRIELIPGAPTVDMVTHSITRAFGRNRKLDAEALSVEVDDGTVMLSGHVSSWVEHDAAMKAAWSAPGVVKVEDRLLVEHGR
jgi:osmotically-inducible protein OsmY